MVKSNSGKVQNLEVQRKQFLFVENEDEGYFEETQLLGSNREKPTKITNDVKWNKINSNAITNLDLALGDEVLFSTEEKKTAKEVRETFTKLHETKSLQNKIFLK